MSPSARFITSTHLIELPFKLRFIFHTLYCLRTVSLKKGNRFSSRTLRTTMKTMLAYVNLLLHTQG